MKENTNTYYRRGSWSQIIVSLSLLLMILLAGCSSSSASEPEDAAEDTTAETDTKQPAEAESEPLSSREELEAEYGEFEEPIESELVDITEKVTVKEVIDGDTVVVEGENGEETISFALIDAPELTLADGTQDENLGLKATDVMRRLQGSTVLLERVEAADDEGNTLGHFWSSENWYYTNFNKLMVKKGLARVDAPTPDAKYLDQFNQAESEAKADQKDIWWNDGYVTEDGFDQ